MQSWSLAQNWGTEPAGIRAQSGEAFPNKKGMQTERDAL